MDRAVRMTSRQRQVLLEDKGSIEATVDGIRMTSRQSQVLLEDRGSIEVTVDGIMGKRIWGELLEYLEGGVSSTWGGGG